MAMGDETVVQPQRQDGHAEDRHVHILTHQARATKVNFSGAEPRSFAAAFRRDLKETFLPDDPFRHLKEQSRGAAACSMVRYFVPILEWAPEYTFSKFRSDLLAGITIASLTIPQGISYARLANLPPIIGLYSSFVPPLIYAVFGSSVNLAVGTEAPCSIFLASTIESQASADEELYLQLFFTAAFFTGVFQATLGILRLGILVDFLSHSTITGFMGGAAIIVILEQLKGLLGLTQFTNKTAVVSVLHAVFTNRHQDYGKFLFFIRVLIACEGSADKTGIGMLQEVQKNLKKKGIKIVLTNPQLRVAEKLVSSKFIEIMGADWVFLSIHEAVAACHFSLQESCHK